jgi:hypothetical protein
MSKRTDLTGRIFNNLTVVKLLGTWKEGNETSPKRRWLCRCVCGNTRTVTTGNLAAGYTRWCEACQQNGKSQTHQARRSEQDFKRNYKSYRDGFTAEQWQLYHSILRGRAGAQNESEAVEMVMREYHSAA